MGPNSPLQNADGTYIIEVVLLFWEYFWKFKLLLTSLLGFSWKTMNTLDLRNPKPHTSNRTLLTWSTREDLRFDRLFWGKSLNSCFIDFWLNLVKYEFNLNYSLGFVLFRACKNPSNSRYCLGEFLAKFLQTLIYGYLA